MPDPIEPTATLLALTVAIVPLVAAWALWVWRWPGPSLQGGVALAVLWNATWLLAANAVAVRIGAWDYSFDGPTVVGMPLPLWFGWTLLWGAVGPLLPLPRSAVVVMLVGVDLIYMPLFDPVVRLGPSWWLVDLAAIAVVAVPGLLLAEWSAAAGSTADGSVPDRSPERSRLNGRVTLQVLLFCCLLLWAVPTVALDLAGRSLGPWPPPWTWGVVVGSLGAVALPGLTAVNELRLAGGSPWPWDTTVRVVRSGPYRYLRSPMQLSGAAVLVVVAAVYRQPSILVAAAVALAYARLFCRLEEKDLARRFGTDWTVTSARLRQWTPLWYPIDEGEQAVVWIDFGCDLCRPIVDFVTARRPIGLTMRDAAGHPEAATGSLTRMRYERADGVTLSGATALGASLEHLNLGWAMVGWVLRLPILWRLWQLIGDGVGFGSRPVTGTLRTGTRVDG